MRYNLGKLGDRKDDFATIVKPLLRGGEGLAMQRRAILRALSHWKNGSLRFESELTSLAASAPGFESNPTDRRLALQLLIINGADNVEQLVLDVIGQVPSGHAVNLAVKAGLCGAAEKITRSAGDGTIKWWPHVAAGAALLTGRISWTQLEQFRSLSWDANLPGLPESQNSSTRQFNMHCKVLSDLVVIEQCGYGVEDIESLDLVVRDGKLYGKKTARGRRLRLNEPED